VTEEKQSDDELLRQIEAAEATKAVCDKNIKQAKALLLQRRQDEIQKLLKAKDEPFGDVTIIVGNHKVKVNVPKKVEWDQPRLEDTWQQMAADGVDPKQYIKVEYGVSETSYKNWPSEMKDHFKPARTVTPGTMSLKVVTEKE